MGWNCLSIPEYFHDLRPKLILNSNHVKYSAYIIHRSVVKFCTEHGTITATLCANFQNDSAANVVVGDLVRSEFKISFGQIYYIASILINKYHIWFEYLRNLNKNGRWRGSTNLATLKAFARLGP